MFALDGAPWPAQRKKHLIMIVTIFIRVLEFLFFAGSIGSMLVVLLVTIEDSMEIFRKDAADEEPSPDGQAVS